MRKVAEIKDDKTTSKIYDELKKDSFDFTIKPCADFQELWVQKDQIKNAKDLINKCGLY